MVAVVVLLVLLVIGVEEKSDEAAASDSLRFLRVFGPRLAHALAFASGDWEAVM